MLCDNLLLIWLAFIVVSPVLGAFVATWQTRRERRKREGRI